MEQLGSFYLRQSVGVRSRLRTETRLFFFFLGIVACLALANLSLYVRTRVYESTSTDSSGSWVVEQVLSHSSTSTASVSSSSTSSGSSASPASAGGAAEPHPILAAALSTQALDHPPWDTALLKYDWCRNCIDVVIPYVNGSDPWYINVMQHFAETDGRKIRVTADQIGKKRSRDHDELVYCLRSIHHHAPWIRYIHIVTNGPQRPVWLNHTHPRIHIVPHSVIFKDSSHLPTFNIFAIKMHLHRIPHLAPKFIYVEDDQMFGRPLTPDLFYDWKGHITFQHSEYTLKVDAKRLPRDNSEWASLRTSARSLIERFPTLNHTAIFYPSHMPVFFHRELYRQALDEVFAKQAFRSSSERARGSEAMETRLLMPLFQRHRERVPFSVNYVFTRLLDLDGDGSLSAAEMEGLGSYLELSSEQLRTLSKALPSITLAELQRVSDLLYPPPLSPPSTNQSTTSSSSSESVRKSAPLAVATPAAAIPSATVGTAVAPPVPVPAPVMPVSQLRGPDRALGKLIERLRECFYELESHYDPSRVLYAEPLVTFIEVNDVLNNVVNQFEAANETRPTLLCINDGMSDINPNQMSEAAMRAFLQSYFPWPSPYEDLAYTEAKLRAAAPAMDRLAAQKRAILEFRARSIASRRRIPLPPTPPKEWKDLLAPQYNYTRLTLLEAQMKLLGVYDPTPAGVVAPKPQLTHWSPGPNPHPNQNNHHQNNNNNNNHNNRPPPPAPPHRPASASASASAPVAPSPVRTAPSLSPPPPPAGSGGMPPHS